MATDSFAPASFRYIEQLGQGRAKLGILKKRVARARGRAHTRFGIAALCLGLMWVAVAVVHAGPRPRSSILEAAPTGPLVRVDPRGAQVIQGFGASGAWWPYDAAHFSPAARERIGDLLFTGAGLDLSMYRYEIGSGGEGVTNPTRAPRSFATSPGVYDWTRDPAGMLFLQQAHDRGVPVLIGVVFSPPKFWTTNGKTCGGSLRPGSERAFAGYITDVVTHLHDEGITLSYVSPMNEPDSSFWGCGQEGAAVPPAQRASVIAALQGPLAARAPYTQVIADESSLVRTELIPHLGSWLTASNASQVAAIATHLYDYPSATTLGTAGAAAAKLGLPLWATEVCCYNGTTFGAGYDPTMTSGLWLADTMWQAIGPGGASSFMWWTALSSSIGCDVRASTCAARPNGNGWNDGLLYYDPGFRGDGNQAVSFTKRFWVLANFSRFVRPGAVRHELTGIPRGVRALAFSSVKGWTIVAINDGSLTVPFNLQLPSTGRYTLRSYRTSPTEDLAQVQTGRWSHSQRAIVSTLAPRSVTTFVLSSR